MVNIANTEQVSTYKSKQQNNSVNNENKCPFIHIVSEFLFCSSEFVSLLHILLSFRPINT